MTGNEAIRVVIVDDHDMLRRGLATYLKVAPDIDLIGEASAGQRALELIEETMPDVVLMGLVMPRVGGVKATRLIISRSTARAHVSKILTKLGVTNQAEAIAFALRNKLVS